MLHICLAMQCSRKQFFISLHNHPSNPAIISHDINHSAPNTPISTDFLNFSLKVIGALDTSTKTVLQIHKPVQ